MEEEFKLCEECDGTGKVEGLNCSRPASYCCGGCYEDYECENCEGTGKLSIL